MSYPSYAEIEYALHAFLGSRKEAGYSIAPRESYGPLADYFGLTELARDQMRSDRQNEKLWHNMVQWARNSLRKKGFLDASTYAVWRLTDDGIRASRFLDKWGSARISYPDDVTDAYPEGSIKTVVVNAHERNPLARRACIEHYGWSCVICHFNFEQTYGVKGREFIHVHHLIPLSEMDGPYEVDPIKDLRPVCPNCHAMLHRRSPPYAIEDLKS